MAIASTPLASAALADFCRRHHSRRMALFDSVLRDDFTPAVRFWIEDAAPGKPTGGIIGSEEEPTEQDQELVFG